MLPSRSVSRLQQVKDVLRTVSARFCTLCHIKETQDQQFVVLVVRQQFLHENTERKQFCRSQSRVTAAAAAVAAPLPRCAIFYVLP